MPKARFPDDEDLSRQETVVEKSDAMAREYSANREIRLREERVRRLTLDVPDRKPPAERRERPTRPPSRRERDAPGELPRTEVSLLETARGDAPAREPARSEAGPAREPARSEAPRPTPGDAGGARAEAPLSAPFPPLRKEREPAPARARGPERLPRGEPVAPPREEAHTPTVDELAMELEELLREFRHGWRNLGHADRVTLVSSVLVLAGVLMPWMSDPAHSLQVGLLSGGVVHVGIAVAAFALIVRGTPGAFGRIGAASRRERVHRHRRASLWLVLLGAASTLLGVYLLVVYGLQKDPAWPVELHFGFYWTLAAGTGLSYGGFSRFARRGSSSL